MTLVRLTGGFSCRLFPFAVLLLTLLCVACTDEGTLDLTPPELTLDIIEPQSFSRERTLTGTMGDDVTGIEVFIGTGANAEDAVLGSGVWSCKVTGLEPGVNSISVTASDARGNTRVLSFTLSYELLRIDKAPYTTNETTPTLSGMLIAGGTISEIVLNDVDLGVDPVFDSSGTIWSLTLPVFSSLLDDSNILEMTALDSEELEQTLSLTLTYDESAVDLQLDPPATPLSDNSTTLSGSMEEGATVSVGIAPDATVGDVIYPTPTTWQVDVTDLEERESVATVTASLSGRVMASTWGRFSVYTKPTVASTLPLFGATDVLPSSEIMVIFSEAVVSTSVNSATFLLEDSSGTFWPGTIHYEGTDKVATFTPENLLTSGEIYTVTLTSNIVDAEENGLTPYSWSFTVY